MPTLALCRGLAATTTKRGGEVSKSELRRMEIVAPEAIKQLREQIAQEIENCHEIRMAFANKNKCNTGECSHLEDAAIARGEK